MDKLIKYDRVTNSQLLKLVSKRFPWQMWFDDVRSLALKYSMAKEKEMLGIGMWTADYLPYYGKYWLSVSYDTEVFVL